MNQNLARVLFVFSWAVSAGTGYAADYDGEVMTLKGMAQVTRQGAALQTDLKQGDLLKTGDRIEVGPASHVDIAYDREWNNITRLSENSVTTIKAIFPTGLKLDRGDLYAKLGKLPSGTTFEVQTPTAVAAARGTEFLVSVDAGGGTEVVSVENRVEVFSLDAAGNLDRQVILESAQKTEVEEIGEPPSPPEKVADADWKTIETMQGDVEQSAREVIDEGREGQTQTIDFIEQSRIESGEFQPPMPGPDSGTSARETDPGTAGEGPGTHAGEFEPQRPPEPDSTVSEIFVPPNIDSIEQRMEQTVDQTIQQTETNLPPPPTTDDPCLHDPANCTTTTTGGN